MTSSLIQTFNEIDRLLPGTELEIHTSASSQALSLRPSLKNVRVLTLPHMEFEVCTVYTGTFGVGDQPFGSCLLKILSQYISLRLLPRKVTQNQQLRLPAKPVNGPKLLREELQHLQRSTRLYWEPL